MYAKFYMKKEMMGWRWPVKSNDCSSRGPEVNSQQPRGGSQPSLGVSGALFWRKGVHSGRALNHE